MRHAQLGNCFQGIVRYPLYNWSNASKAPWLAIVTECHWALSQTNTQLRTTLLVPQHMHVPTHTYSYMHTHTYTQTLRLKKILILFQNEWSEYFFKYQKHLNSVKINNDYFNLFALTVKYLFSNNCCCYNEHKLPQVCRYKSSKFVLKTLIANK